MLQFWKRSGHKEKTRSTSPQSFSSPISVNGDEGKFLFSNVECSGILTTLDDEGLCDIGDADISNRPCSRLSKTLTEVLADKAALGYFIQYLEIQGGLSLVRCWLDIESFRSAAQVSDGPCSHNTITRDQLEENLDMRYLSPLTSSRLEHDSLSVSTDCDSFTADSNSLYEFSPNTLSEARSCSVAESGAVGKMQRDLIKVDGTLSNNCDKDVSDISCKLHKLDMKDNVRLPDGDVTDTSLVTERSCVTVHDKKCRREKVCQTLLDDALRIFKKYIAQEAPHTIMCNEDLRNGAIEAMCSEEGVLDPCCYDRIQKYVYDIMEQQYFNNYFQSHYHCKYQIDVLTSGNIELPDVLYNESILFYFMEFLEQEGARTLLEFWLVATNFRQQLLDPNTICDSQEAQNDAIILYDKYFSLQALCPLGFGDKIRFVIEENICREGGPVPDCFHQPIRLVEYALEKHYMRMFLSSQLYFKYLSELISTVQTNGCVGSQLRRRGTYSDCSSEVSISVHNTLLAMEDSNRSVRSGGRRADMNIDTRQLYDPDSLWKRRKARRLSFGRVTDLGRFETDVEPEPDRKSESRLTRAMRRLVNLEENKTKEEMAWQVAEMIVKDITSVTLAEVRTNTQS